MDGQQFVQHQHFLFFSVGINKKETYNYIQVGIKNTMPKVLNKHKDTIPINAIYIGRGSFWGNPFKIGQDGSRVEVIEKYRQYINNSKFINEIRKELRGKDLWCFCSPKLCHGDILLEIANS